MRTGAHRLAAVAALSLFPACTAGSPSTSSGIWLIPKRGPDVRVTITGGCPAGVTYNEDVRNDQAELDDTLVPSDPSGGLVCRYAANAGTPSLYRRTTLNRSQAGELAAAIDRVSTTAPLGTTSCPAAFPSATILVFSYPRHSDVDLWYNDTGCQTLDNGRVGAFQGGNPAFYGPFESLIDRLSPGSR